VPKRLRCQLLCEDIEQERFFRPVLERHFHRVYVEPRKPHGGASFVLQHIKRLADYIRQHHQEAVGLLVVIDGDAAGLQGRLDEIRTAAGLAGAAWEERIARCVPSRSVETWEMWLCGQRELDERTSYKEAYRRECERGAMSARKAAGAWFVILTPEEQQAEEARLPALAYGRKEVARLRQFAKP
jgi:hypothetical protein